MADELDNPYLDPPKPVVPPDPHQPRKKKPTLWPAYVFAAVILAGVVVWEVWIRDYVQHGIDHAVR